MRQKSKIRIVLEIVFRVLLVTFVFTLLGFAVGLFCGIGVSIIYGSVRHIHPDMTMAYKFVAAPFGAAVLVITFIAMLVYEIRRARLTSLQRTS